MSSDPGLAVEPQEIRTVGILLTAALAEYPVGCETN